MLAVCNEKMKINILQKKTFYFLQQDGFHESMF